MSTVQRCGLDVPWVAEGLLDFLRAVDVGPPRACALTSFRAACRATRDAWRPSDPGVVVHDSDGLRFSGAVDLRMLRFYA